MPTVAVGMLRSLLPPSNEPSSMSRLIDGASTVGRFSVNTFERLRLSRAHMFLPFRNALTTCAVRRNTLWRFWEIGASNALKTAIFWPLPSRRFSAEYRPCPSPPTGRDWLRRVRRVLPSGPRGLKE